MANTMTKMDFFINYLLEAEGGKIMKEMKVDTFLREDGDEDDMGWDDAPEDDDTFSDDSGEE